MKASSLPHYFNQKARKFRYIIIEKQETIRQASIEQRVSNSGRKLSEFPSFSAKVWTVSIDVSLL